MAGVAYAEDSREICLYQGARGSFVNGDSRVNPPLVLMSPVFPASSIIEIADSVVVPSLGAVFLELLELSLPMPQPTSVKASRAMARPKAKYIIWVLRCMASSARKATGR
jgi:hypothetical protein